MSTARWPTAAVAEGYAQLGWARPGTARELYATTRRFQLGWALGAQLVDDGDPGPKTCAALEASLTAQRAGQPTASAHFSFTEFACKCRGHQPGCERILVRRPLLVALEVYRARFSPNGMVIVSGYRCPAHNASIGSMDDSRHTTGEACDISPIVGWPAVRGLGRFSGIGYQGATKNVRHVDVRGLCHLPLPRKTPHATVRTPAVWLYS